MHFAKNSDDILFAVHAPCLELARLVFRRYGQQDDLKQFIRCLIYQRRKNLDEKEEMPFPEPTLRNISPCYIDWGNDSYYGLRRKNGQEPTRTRVSSLVFDHFSDFDLGLSELIYDAEINGAGGIL